MSGESSIPPPNSVTVQLGCEPIVFVTITENEDGTLHVALSQPEGADPVDLDGLFFNLTDDSRLSEFNVFPKENDQEITDYQASADSVNQLSNGATTMDSYDAGLQFGLSPDSTEGEVTETAFTLWSDDGPITLDDIDLDSLTAIINSDTSSGTVLTVNDGEDGGTGGGEDGTCSFIVEGAVNVEVTITELENGDLQIELNVLSGDDPDATGLIGDLRALMLDIEDESLLDGLTISGEDVTSYAASANNVTDLGNGANLKGEVVNQNGAFDAGVELGTQGIGQDDIQSTTIVLSHPDGLSLEDISEQDIGIRLTSVGAEGEEEREESLKLVGQCPGIQQPPVCEDQYALGDLVALFNLDPADMPLEDGSETLTTPWLPDDEAILL